MKLSFSTKGWHGYLWEDFCNIAVSQGFNGIELHNVNNPAFTEKNGAFYMGAAQATVRELYEKNLRIPCIDTLKNPASKSDREEFLEELNKCLEIASTLHIPFVRIKASDTGAAYEEQKAEVISVLQSIIPEAEKNPCIFCFVHIRIKSQKLVCTNPKSVRCFTISIIVFIFRNFYNIYSRNAFIFRYHFVHLTFTPAFCANSSISFAFGTFLDKDI